MANIRETLETGVSVAELFKWRNSPEKAGVKLAASKVSAAPNPVGRARRVPGSGSNRAG